MTTIDDLAEIEVWYQHWGAALVLYARQWCSHPEDAVQEAFLDLVRSSTRPMQPKAWLYHAVRCKAMNLARSEHRRARNEKSTVPKEWFVPNPSASIEQSEVRRMLEQLGPLEREIVVSRIWGEMSFEEIAELVERPVSTVFRYYKKAIQQMANQFEEPSPSASNTALRHNHE